jgi:hypothetical protein
MLTLVVVTPGAAITDVAAKTGTIVNATAFRIETLLSFPVSGISDTKVQLFKTLNSGLEAYLRRRVLPARLDHCTVPRALPLGVRQEHPVPIGAELVRAHVRTWVTQYPPEADAIGV